VAIIWRLAAQAKTCLYLAEDEKMDVSPHILRHTFLRQLADT
jgi:hypothetical protein